jgi:hypothetical protein
LVLGKTTQVNWTGQASSDYHRGMASNSALILALPVSLAVFGVLAKFGFDMKRDNKPRQMWGYFCWSVVPFAAVALMWASQEGIAVGTRNIVLGIVGAAIGAAGLIWTGYLVEGRSKEHTPEPTAHASDVPQNAIGTVTGNSGVITQGQKGDNK